MLRRLKFRHRLGLLVALAATALVTVTVVTLILGRQSVLEVQAIETRYVPLIELGHDLDVTFSQIQKALEDAAAAADETRLADADRLATELRARMTNGARTLRDNGADPRALAAAFDRYYAAAHEVSSAIVDGQPVAELGAPIEAMRRAQQAFATALAEAAAPDRERISAAFRTARESQQTALSIEIVVAASALLLMVLLSWQISRRTVRAVQDVASGVERIARGEFDKPIPVETADEIGDLAREANRTAERLREAHDALEARAAELARASKYKSEFLANMSHELRTPLNSIMILSQVLAENRESTLTPKQIEFATLIHKSGQELLALINEVLDLSKVEAGKQSISVERVPVADIADYARRMFTPLAGNKNITLDVVRRGDLPEAINTDRARLTQIMKNLVSNAIKFTEHGGVTVTLASAGEMLELSVTDTGIGIPEDKRALIFEAFAQVESGTSRKFGGTGLGLTIAKQLAIRLGGDLSVTSQLDKGSTFTLVLPVAGPPGEPIIGTHTPGPITRLPEATAPDVADDVLEGKTVLLVDDDMRNVYSLTSALRARNLEILTATDADEADDELAKHPEVHAVLVGARVTERDRFAPRPVIALQRPVDVDRLVVQLRAELGKTAG